MTDHLRSCPECHRHVFERDAECPFCNAKMSPVLLRAVATAAAVALSMATAACGDKPAPVVPDGVPSADAGVTAPTPDVPPVPRGDKGPAPVYGGPPP